MLTNRAATVSGHIAFHRWVEEVAPSFRQSGVWPDRTLAGWASQLVEKDPARVILSEGGRDFSVEYLYGSARSLAGAFIRRGFVPGDVVSYQLPNWHESAIVNLAAAMAGLVVHHLVATYRARELRFMLADCNSRMIFVPAEFRGVDYREMMRAVVPELPVPPETVVVRGNPLEFSAFEALIDSSDSNVDLPVVSPDAPKFIMYTSGTTGRSKGVVHSHNTAYANALFPLLHMGVSADSCYLVAPPVTHVSGTVFGHELPFITGARAIYLDTFTGAAAVELLQKYRCTQFNGATPFMAAIAAAAQAPLTDVVAVGCGGAAAPSQLLRQIAELCPNAAVFRIYGCTEAPCITKGVPRDQLEHGVSTDGALGRTELRLDGPDSDAGEGEILVRGAQAMLGYLRDEDNEAAFDESGYFRTGDIARVRDGFVTIVARKKDLIIRSGENISPKEIEDLLYSHPQIIDVAVVAMPHPQTGECVCAFIVARDRAAISIESMTQWLDGVGLSRRKVPEVLVLVDELPRSPQGKVLKQALRDRARALAAEPGLSGPDVLSRPTGKK